MSSAVDNQKDLGNQLIAAAERGDCGEVDRLLDRGADIHAGGVMGPDDALRGAVNNRHGDTARLLLRRGARIPSLALRTAAAHGDFDLVKLFLAHGADDLTAEFRGYALHWAIVSRRMDIGKFLLTREADIHVNNEGPLAAAALRGDEEMVALLLERGANPGAKGCKALENAAWRGHTDLVNLLLERGADIHARHDQPLHGAILGGQTETVALLLERGADIHAQDDEAQRLAIQGGHTETVALLAARDSLERLAAAAPRNLVYGAAAIAARLGLQGEELADFTGKAVTGPRDKARAEKLGVRAYLEAGGLRDMAAESAETILLAQLLLDSGRAGRQGLAEVTEARVREWTTRLMAIAGRLLLHEQPLEGMLALGREWHIGGNAIPDALRPLRGGHWHAVIPEIKTPALLRTWEGEDLPIIVKALTSQAELAQESRQLNHCVGTADYGTQCRAGKTHILSFQARDKSLATVQVNVTGDDRAPLADIQFRGKLNGTPPEAAQHAWQWLEEQLKSGKVKLNQQPERGWGEIPMENPPPAAVRTMGDWPSEYKVHQWYRHLREHLKLKVPTVREVRRASGLLSDRVPREGYPWREALMLIRDGFNGVMKESGERSGLHALIKAAGMETEWQALVDEARGVHKPATRGD